MHSLLIYISHAMELREAVLKWYDYLASTVSAINSYKNAALKIFLADRYSYGLAEESTRVNSVVMRCPHLDQVFHIFGAKSSWLKT